MQWKRIQNIPSSPVLGSRVQSVVNIIDIVCKHLPSYYNPSHIQYTLLHSMQQFTSCFASIPLILGIGSGLAFKLASDNLKIIQQHEYRRDHSLAPFNVPPAGMYTFGAPGFIHCKMVPNSNDTWGTNLGWTTTNGRFMATRTNKASTWGLSGHHHQGWWWWA